MTRLQDLEKKALAGRDGRVRVKDLLRSKDLSIAAAARGIGERNDTVTRVLAGEQSPRAERIRQKLSKLLGLSRAELDQLLDHA